MTHEIKTVELSLGDIASICDALEQVKVDLRLSPAEKLLRNRLRALLDPAILAEVDTP